MNDGTAPDLKTQAADLWRRVRDHYGQLEASQRANLTRGALVIGFVGVALAAYYGAGDRAEEQAARRARPQVATIEVGDSRLEDDIRAQVERERQEQLNQNRIQDRTIGETQEKLTAQERQIELMTQALQAMQAGEQNLGTPRAGASERSTERPPVSDDPLEWERNGRSGPLRSSAPVLAAPAPVPVTFIGDIGLAARPATLPATTERRDGAPEPAGGSTRRTSSDSGGKKNNSRRFFLPVSFMSAKLLTGLKAKTVDAAKSDPEPMLLRVQAPAVLPNEVRAQLQGCFVIAHGYGSLASERVEARLVSLSCVDYAGRSVIEQEITGILVDDDGVKGLAGRPVTKMGANMSRMFIAGLLEGAGEAVEQGSVTTSVSALGQTRTVDPDQVARAGAGRGVSQAAEELSKVYAELVRQAAPVIEVGPSKNVSVLLTQGVWLEVNQYAQ